MHIKDVRCGSKWGWTLRNECHQKFRIRLQQIIRFTDIINVSRLVFVYAKALIGTRLVFISVYFCYDGSHESIAKLWLTIGRSKIIIFRSVLDVESWSLISRKLSPNYFLRLDNSSQISPLLTLQLMPGCEQTSTPEWLWKSKSIRTRMRLKWTFWDILGNFFHKSAHWKKPRYR